MIGALDGVRVLDFSTLLPGPMATLFLADAGAEVIKIERPGRGDEMRVYVPKWGTDSSNFHMLNRGKKSVALDLKTAEDRDRLRPLIESADVLVEQFRPGVMDRLGLGYDDVRALKPDIIYCAITGYGQDGPKSLRAGHDLNYIGDTGLLALSHGTAETPVIPPALLADIAAGAYPALFNILLALRRRDQTSEGAYLDISMADNVFPFLYWAQGEGQVQGAWPGNGDALVTGGSPRYRLYPTADGKFAAVAAIEPKFWAACCEMLELEEPLRDDTIDPQATIARVAELIAAQPSDHWEKVFADADCCCSIVRSLKEAMADAHFRARGVFGRTQVNEHGEAMASLPTAVVPAFRAGGGASASAPLLGADTEALTCDDSEPGGGL